MYGYMISIIQSFI